MNVEVGACAKNSLKEALICRSAVVATFAALSAQCGRVRESIDKIEGQASRPSNREATKQLLARGWA